MLVVLVTSIEITTCNWKELSRLRLKKKKKIAFLKLDGNTMARIISQLIKAAEGLLVLHVLQDSSPVFLFASHLRGVEELN